LNKRVLFIVTVVLILFSSLIAVTQEADVFSPVSGDAAAPEDRSEASGEYSSGYENTKKIPDWIKPARWFRSNSGGMAVEEVSSQAAAIRNEYALAVVFTRKEELPKSLIPYYSDDFFIEARILYEKGLQKRTQWILRDRNGTSRVVGVLLPSELADSKNNSGERENGLAGFIEIYDERSFLITEYRFFENGTRNRTDYAFKENFLISSTVYLWEENDNGGEYVESYADFLRYNRSLFLRGVERVFYKERKISLSDAPLIVSFPRNLADAAHIKKLLSEKINSYPKFFGEVFVYENERIVYTTDERSRILSQTLYDDENNIVWVINNTWLNDRIVSTLKKEGAAEYLAEYVYDSDGGRIIERNFKNGILERVVHTEGTTDIEELYINNTVVLRAVWEDGRKISETRVGIR